jgi:anti-sigma factor RsiW
MDLEFDKEIDALLRQSAQGETAFAPKAEIRNPKSKHLDADEISAFAESALPEATKQKYARHLADCGACRKSLSSLIRLSVAPENAAAVQSQEKYSAAAPIPWYRKLVAFPNLAYTLGALVLVFSGIVAYTVLRNVNNLESAEVSQISERQPNGKGMNSGGEAAPTESYSGNTMTSNANMMMSNSASMNFSTGASANFSNPAMPSSAPSAATMNSNAAVMLQKDSDKNVRAESKSLAPPQEPANSAVTQGSIAAADAAQPAAKENDYQLDAETQRQQPNQTQNSVAQNQTQIMPDSRNVQQRAPTALSANEKSRKVQDSKDDKQEKSNEPISVGGKTFKRENNVWYDSAYRGQATTNVTRGTNEYKKLDAGLRGIAENLGGSIVVVWKQKAYRIQ